MEGRERGMVLEIRGVRVWSMRHRQGRGPGGGRLLYDSG